MKTPSPTDVRARLAVLLFLSAATASCDETFAALGEIQVSIDVTKSGAGSGSVISSNIGGSDDLACDAQTLDAGNPCQTDFSDANGAGVMTLTATPEAGSQHVGWTGSCTPAASCTVTPANGTVTLEFSATTDVDFTIGVEFDLVPPPALPTEAILFESHRDGNPEVYQINPDGSGIINRSNDPADDRDPVWSPDRMQIAFASDRNGDDEIFVMDADGMNQGSLTPLIIGSSRRPAYSPDGTQIAFDNDGDGDDEVWVMDVDGGAQTQLTFNDVDFDQGPTWSMNSAQILFTTFRTGSDDLFVMDRDGMNQTLRVDTGEHDWQPDWSPDGTRIVFTVQDGAGVDNIWIVNADGQTGLRQLTFGNAEDREATWSPDGTWIAFTSDRMGNRDIFLMTPDGGNVTRLTTDPAEDSRPSWVH